jgi:hypothetical protein
MHALLAQVIATSCEALAGGAAADADISALVAGSELRQAPLLQAAMWLGSRAPLAPAAKARVSSEAGGPTSAAGWHLQHHCWASLDAVQGLWQEASSSQATQPQQQQQQQQQVPAALAAQLLVASLQALVHLAEPHLVPVLRCLRRCWRQALHQQELQDAALQLAAQLLPAPPAAAAAPAASTPSKPGSTSSEPTTAEAAGQAGAAARPDTFAQLCWLVARSLTAAVKAAGRKKGLFCAALVNTALQPSMFLQPQGSLRQGELQQQQQQLAALHQPGIGPLHWMVQQLVACGGSSARLALLLALRLAR